MTSFPRSRDGGDVATGRLEMNPWAASNAEDAEKAAPERLGLSLLVSLAGPEGDELAGVGLLGGDGKTHRVGNKWKILSTMIHA